MAYTEFYCDPAAANSNLNSGSASPASPWSDTGGDWDGTEWYEPVGSIPTSVVPGSWASMYSSEPGTPVTNFIARVDEKTATQLRLSTTARCGTAQPSGTDVIVRVGGTWKGPSSGGGGTAFPFNLVTGALVDGNGAPTRVNFKAGNFNSVGLTRSLAGPIVFQGYNTNPGDEGRATFTVSSGAVLQLNSGCTDHVFRNLEFKSTALSGTGRAVLVNGGSNLLFAGCVFNNARGPGIEVGASVTDVVLVECEAFTCNRGNVQNVGAYHLVGNRLQLIRCIAHDNSTGATDGFRCTGSGITLVACIADSNSSHGFYLGSPTPVVCLSGDSFSNAGSGYWFESPSANLAYLENCNAVRNGTGFDGSAEVTFVKLGLLLNSGLGGGAFVNTHGGVYELPALVEEKTVQYTTHPWANPEGGNFSIISSESQGRGRGTFTQTQANYSGTVAYPDIGATQHIVPPPFGVTEVVFIGEDAESLRY